LAPEGFLPVLGCASNAQQHWSVGPQPQVDIFFPTHRSMLYRTCGCTQRKTGSSKP